MHKFLTCYTLAGFEPAIFGSNSGDDDHATSDPTIASYKTTGSPVRF
jgi:hypothetical protein